MLCAYAGDGQGARWLAPGEECAALGKDLQVGECSARIRLVVTYAEGDRGGRPRGRVVSAYRAADERAKLSEAMAITLAESTVTSARMANLVEA